MGSYLVKNIVFSEISSQYRRSKENQLENISLTMKEGELTLLMGPSGSGKSTLVLLLNGIIPHHTRAKVSGELTVFGKNPLSSSVLEMSSLVGMLLQDPESQLATSRVRDEIIFTLEFQGKSPSEIDNKVQTLLKEYEIEHLAESDSTRLSGGEKQLVALAAMMALDPEIIVLDEPTSNLDPVNTEKILTHIQRFRNQGKTVILIEHKINEVFNFCPPDRIILMNEGRIITHETPMNLFRTPLLEEIGLAIPLIAQYIENSGLRERKADNLPLSILQFKNFIKALTNEELLLLQQSLNPPRV